MTTDTKFSVEKKPLIRALKVAGTSLGAPLYDRNRNRIYNKDENFKITVSSDGLVLQSHCALTFTQASLPVVYTEGQPKEAYEFCVNGQRLMSAVGVLDENERLHFVLDSKRSSLYITSRAFKGAIPITLDTEAAFRSFSDFLPNSSPFGENGFLKDDADPHVFETAQLIQGLKFLRKLPDSASGDGASNMIEIKNKIFVAGDAARLGFYEAPDLDFQMKINGDVVASIIGFFQSTEHDHFILETGNDSFRVARMLTTQDKGAELFGFKEWGLIPDGTITRKNAYEPYHQIIGDKVWLLNIMRKVKAYLPPSQDTITIQFDGEGKAGRLTVAATNENGDQISESYNVNRSKSDSTESYSFKLKYDGLLETLESFASNNIEMSVDKRNVVRVRENLETATATVLMSPVR